MNKRINRITYFLAVLFAVLFVISFIGGGVGVAYAATTVKEYSGVLDDLQKDSSFNINDYPADDNDRSLQIITVAESISGKLFIYVYEPWANAYTPESVQINMSLTDKLGGTVDYTSELTGKDKPHLYDLSLVDRSGVLCKYLVDDFAVSSDSVRYYNIVEIYRSYIGGFDNPSGNDNEKIMLYSHVDTCYRFETANGSVECYRRKKETVKIVNPYVDFLRYYNGLTWGELFGAGEQLTDIHYIAFSADRKIDELKEADVVYTTQTYHKEAFSSTYNYGVESSLQYITLTGEMTDSLSGGFLGADFSWKNIMTTADFIKTVGLKENSVAYGNIKNCDFVLVFLKTSRIEQKHSSLLQGHSYEISGTKVSRATILRLCFNTAGKTYNLGTLMDILEGDENPGNEPKPESIGFWAYVWRCIVRLFKGTATLTEQIVAIVAIFIVLLALPILVMVLSICFPAFRSVVQAVLKGILTGLKWLFKALWWLICLPFKGIAALIHKIRGE